MRGPGRAAAFLVVTALFAGACTLGGGSTIPTAKISRESSPSSTTSNAATSSPPAASPSAEATQSAAGLAVISLPVHNGEVGVGYLAVSFQASGGTAPYTWVVASGTLPPGLALSGGGTLTGNDTAAGNFNFDVKVTDSAGQVATGSTKIKVFPALAISQPCANVCFIGVGCTACGRFGALSGGAGPYTYKIVAGAVPAGMTLNGFTLNGAFPQPALATVDALSTGPPRTLFNLAVQVTDGFGVSKTAGANWLEFGPIGMQCSTTPCVSCLSSPCVDSTSITYSGGNPSDAVTAVVAQVCDIRGASCVTDPGKIAAALPPGWAATAKGGNVTVSFDCGNGCPNGFQAQVFVVLVDHGGCVAPAYVESQAAIVNVDI